MEILSSIVGTVAKHTVVPIGRQASYLIFYKGNFSMLAVHVEKLEAARERIMHSVEEERRNGKKIERDVINWLEIVDEVIEKANQLQKDPRRANARCSAWSFPNLILRHRLSRKATKIVKDFIELQEKGKFDRIGFLPILYRETSSSSTRGGEKYETRESLKENIMKALAHHNSCNIGVYGLGGVGKTTLVEEVFEISKQHTLFDTVVKMNVTKDPNIKTIQGDIADLLGLRFDEETIFGRARRLRQRIMMEKNILVILDDIRTKLDLKKVGIPFGNEHNGCKLLMTSRNLDVLLQMDVPMDFTFKLELMSENMIENETWNLFQIMAGDVVKDMNLQSLAIQVAKKCAGLPLVVAIVARAMKDKRDVQSWKDALRRLLSDHDTTFSALELSYNSLESDEMRDVFLLFALFPCEKVHYFLKVAMGLDILKGSKTVDDARNRLYSIIHSLEVTCLIEIKTSGNIQMHDFVRDFAISIARRDKHVFLRKQSDEEWPTNYFLTRCTHVVLDSCVSVLPQTIDCPNIKFFSLSSKKNRSLEVPDDFFEGMGSLRVLDFTFLNLSSLPTSFRFLTDLQTLCLNFCILEHMVEINALKNLVILCLFGSSMTKLPRELGQLTQLRMLDLSNSRIEVIPPNILSSLTKLEELYMGNTFVNWEDVSSTVENRNASIAELQKLPNLTTLELQIRETWMLPRDLQTVFEKLERYKIAIGDVWEWSDIVNGTSNTLMLKLGTNIHLYHGIKALIKGVENLYLDDVGGIQNVVYQLNVEGFPLLKHLHVQNNANMKHIVDSQDRNQIHVSFPILETLVLHNLKNLEHICLNPISIACFGSLSVIQVKKCCQLKYLFSSTMIGSFKNLKHIEISNCPLMEEIIAKEKRNNEVEEESNSHCLNNKCVGSLFPKLEVLDIEECPLLESIFPFFLSTQGLKNLEKLSIKDCKHLRSLFKCKLNLCNLKTIKLQSCPMLVSLFQPFTYQSLVLLEELQITNCKGLENIISDERSEGESREEIDDDHDEDDERRASMLQKLKVLDIEGCPRLEYILPLLSAQGLPVLEAIKIRSCVELKNIFDQDHSMIYHLYIWERVQCVSILQSHSMCNIKEINLSHFLKIKSVFILSITPRLLVETLTITNCNELKNIVIDTADQDSGGNSWGDVFPRLKRINVEDCIQLEYIFGQSSDDVHRNPNKIHLHLPTLEHINLCNLPSLVAMSTKQYRTTCPLLVELELKKCSQIAMKSFQDFKIQTISKPQGTEISVEIGSTSTNAEILSSSSGQLIAPEHKSTSHDYGDIEDVKVDGSQEITEINNEGSLNMKASSNIKEQIPKDDDVRVSKSSKRHLNMKNGIVSNNYEIVETEMNATTEGQQEFVVNIPGLVIKMKQRENSEIFVETKMKQTAEANQEFVVNVSGLEILEVANSQKLLNEQSTSQLREIDTAVKPSLLEGSTSEKTEAATMSTTSELKNEPDGIKTVTSSTHSKSVSSSSGPLATSETSPLEYGDSQTAIDYPPIVITKPLTTQDADVKNLQETSKTNDDQVSLNNEDQFPKEVKLKIPESEPYPIIPSPLAFQTSSMLPKGDPSQIDEKLEDGDDKIAITSFSIAATDNNDQVSLNNDALKKESSNIEEQFPKDDDIIVSKSPVASQFPTVPSKGDPSQKVEDLSSSLFVKTELEQLVSKKHLDYANLSLLTDFLIKHPSVLLKDTSLSNRYKGCAYNLLADLLKFLKTHSVLEVLSSCHAEFVELLQDARSFDFDQDWLDGVERRTLLPDLKVSQDTLQKDVELQHLKIEDLKHQLTSSEAVLKNIIQQQADLSAPIGY